MVTASELKPGMRVKLKPVEECEPCDWDGGKVKADSVACSRGGLSTLTFQRFDQKPGWFYAEETIYSQHIDWIDHIIDPWFDGGEEESGDDSEKTTAELLKKFVVACDEFDQINQVREIRERAVRDNVPDGKYLLRRHGVLVVVDDGSVKSVMDGIQVVD